ncbi:acetoin utilization deacetylase AcuC-like enzyme [Methylobacterium sp. BE186]|uniref:histone deacetylase family protein n=1 Tax=Methylobacterium sp. BE186 TaxID=2817715 RepID=UPI0028579DED|nr:histone deacetylase family protein [Methylobacterium sp. BE186]MDR7038567.1 acetoin utilization deacetylase AcuC-like enzyme [Methylobacterium sp. BE186]
MTILFHHPAALEHRTPHGHPERPERMRAVQKALEAEAFAGLDRRAPEPASLGTVALAHPEAWVQAIVAAAPTEGLVSIDSDTVLSPGTMECVLRGVGAGVQGVDAVMTGAAKNVFSAMRPPGHHAEKTRAMGFCVFNNAAIAARHARSAHGAERVAIVDWDVHHGNGSQDIFWDDPSVLFCSSHQMPLYPGSGALSEEGEHGTIVNAPLRPGSDGETFREAFESRILPRLKAFRPDLIIVSAGFDAHWRDPLANLMLEADDFAWATRQVLEEAERSCQGRVVSLLEGGYDLTGLADSVAAHVQVLMEA